MIVDPLSMFPSYYTPSDYHLVKLLHQQLPTFTKSPHAPTTKDINGHKHPNRRCANRTTFVVRIATARVRRKFETCTRVLMHLTVKFNSSEFRELEKQTPTVQIAKR